MKLIAYEKKYFQGTLYAITLHIGINGRYFTRHSCPVIVLWWKEWNLPDDVKFSEHEELEKIFWANFGSFKELIQLT